jgi:hypothetical protein
MKSKEEVKSMIQSLHDEVDDLARKSRKYSYEADDYFEKINRLEHRIFQLEWVIAEVEVEVVHINKLEFDDWLIKYFVTDNEQLYYYDDGEDLITWCDDNLLNEYFNYMESIDTINKYDE